MKKHKQPEAMYCIWQVFYGTYEEIERDGDKPAVRVSESMTYAQALKTLEMLDATYCAKPWN